MKSSSTTTACNLFEKVVLITGASSGIGRALAELMASEGFIVIAAGRNKEALASLQKSSRYIRCVEADITTDEGRKKIITALKNYETLSCIVHNAAILTPFGSLRDVSKEDIEKTHQTNIIAPILLTQLLIDKIGPQSRILNIISNPQPNKSLDRVAGIYRTTKEGLDKFTDTLVETEFLAASAYPGRVDTPGAKTFREKNFATSSYVEKVRMLSTIQELIPPMKAARFLHYLLCNTKDEEFKKEKHSIYDAKHHEEWLNPGESLYPSTLHARSKSF